MKKVYYYYFLPNLDCFEKYGTNFTLMDGNHELVSGGLIRPESRETLDHLLNVLKGSRDHAIMAIRDESKVISDIAKIRLSGVEILNAYDHFDKIMNCNTHILTSDSI